MTRCPRPLLLLAFAMLSSCSLPEDPTFGKICSSDDECEDGQVCDGVCAHPPAGEGEGEGEGEDDLCANFPCSGGTHCELQDILGNLIPTCLPNGGGEGEGEGEGE